MLALLGPWRYFEAWPIWQKANNQSLEEETRDCSVLGCLI